MKKFAAVLAATAVLGVTSAFAANPFSDVTPNDWAYQAVAQLASQGVINGYPDGTFKGQNNITRFEMAQMVAKAMARQDRVDAEQNAMINRLANEFSSELNTLGVRVSKLEDQVGNFKFTGDARMRYQQWDGQKSKFDYRGRVMFTANVNDNTKAGVRILSSNEFGKSSGGAVKADRVYVTHNFGKNVSATAGRQNLTIGGGLAYDSTFDGVAAVVGTNKLNASVAYGYLVEGPLDGANHTNNDSNSNATMVIYGLNGQPAKNVNLSAFYAQLNGDRNDKSLQFQQYLFTRSKGGEKISRDSFYGFAAHAKFDKVKVGGEWIKAQNLKDSTAWIATLGYGNYNMAKAGTYLLQGQYYNAEKNAQVFDSTYVLPVNNNIKTWIVTGKYVPAKNVALAAYVGLDAKDQNDKKIAGGTWYRGEVNYKF